MEATTIDAPARVPWNRGSCARRHVLLAGPERSLTGRCVFRCGSKRFSAPPTACAGTARLSSANFRSRRGATAATRFRPACVI